MNRRTLTRSGRFLSTAAVAVALVGAGTTAAHADGSGTLHDPWVPAHPARVICQDATRFQAYDEGSYNLRGAQDTVHYGDEIVVRYETNDRYAVETKFSPAATNWAFMQRSCIQFH